MATPAPTPLAQLTTALGGLSPGRKMTLALTALGAVGFFAYLMLWAGRPEFQPLYSELSLEDAGVIVERLKGEKIPYEIAAGGRTIRIPKERVAEIRLAMASQGLPQGTAVGFEIFDNTKLGLTEFAQNVNFQRALQGELARTINRFEEVESSRVHLVLSKKTLFLDNEQPASASVILKLRPGRQLGKSQVQAIVHLVSSSIAGLAPQNVTVVDNFGGMLAGQRDAVATGGASADQLEFQGQVERGLEERIKSMLETVLGPGRAVARVSCAIDFTRQEKTEEIYDPNSKVVRSEKESSEASSPPSGIAAGIPGAAANLGDTPAPAAGSGPLFQKQDRTMNYEIAKVTSRKVMPAGSLTRLSVAVMVDGTYQSVAGADGKMELKYQERSPEEMAKLEMIVKRAVNFDPNRGDEVAVTNISFETERPVGADEGQAGGWPARLKLYAPAIKYGLAALFLLLSFLFLVRPLVRWLTAAPGEVEMLKQLPMTVGEIENRLGGPTAKLAGAPPKALQVIQTDRESSIGLIKEWLKEA
jgi:flagellar M-ring protein FliF